MMDTFCFACSWLRLLLKSASESLAICSTRLLLLPFTLLDSTSKMVTTRSSSPVSELSMSLPPSSRPPSRVSYTSDLHPDLLPPSKREYLLAQIRQKDQIIESLLKQVLRCLLHFLHHVANHITGLYIATQPIPRHTAFHRILPYGHLPIGPKQPKRPGLA